MNRLSTNGFDREHNQAIVEQEHISGPGVARKFFVVQSYAILVTQLRARSIKHKRSPCFQHHTSLGEFADPDLGALQVCHDGHLPARTLGRFAHHLRSVYMILCASVAEVQAHHIDTRVDHLLQQRHLTGGRTQGCNDLRGATGGE